MSKTRSTAPAPEQLKLQIDSEVTRSIRQHARAHMKTEVCGVLIGEERDGIVEIQASIEASNAAQAGTHVTFTQDAWEEIYRVKDQTYPDHRIVGWYHSHPGFGVFLSEHDTFIHRNFFTSPNQVAWVYDPHTDEEGCFGWSNGEIERVAELSIVDRNGDGEERTPKERAHTESDEDVVSTNTPPPTSRKTPTPWVAVLARATSYVLVAFLGFLVCFFLFPNFVGVVIDPRTLQPLSIDGHMVLFGRIQLDELKHAVSGDPKDAPLQPVPLPQSTAPPAQPAPPKSNPRASQ